MPTIGISPCNGVLSVNESNFNAKKGQHFHICQGRGGWPHPPYTVSLTLQRPFFDNHPKDMTTFILYSTSIKKNCWSHIFSSWIHLSCSPSFSWLSQRLWYCLCPACMEFMVTMVTETKPIFVKWHLTFSLHLREGPQKKHRFLWPPITPSPTHAHNLSSPFTLKSIKIKKCP